MPYIKERKMIDDLLSWGTEPKFTEGQKNYFITKFLLKFEPKCYEDYEKIIGLLECVKLEMYRRALAPYEDKKKEENGDVYS